MTKRGVWLAQDERCKDIDIGLSPHKQSIRSPYNEAQSSQVLPQVKTEAIEGEENFKINSIIDTLRIKKIIYSYIAWKFGIKI